MLILFDVDATLITTSRTGIQAMGLAGRAAFGDTFDEHRVEYAGRLDPLIIADLLSAHAQPVSPETVEAFRAGYRDHLSRLVVEPGMARPCPGIVELLDAIETDGGFTLGLLTGNYPDTGAIKLRAAGIDPDRFPITVWGCDSPHDPPARAPPGRRVHPLPRAVRREVSPEQVLIVGDTPHDVSCARAHGCRVLAVGTGSFGTEHMPDADGFFDDLSRTEEVLDWIRTTLAQPLR
ncbi:MAG: HAD family hydrolase [Phycisphaerales bacterium]